jgi:hypothetical protein
LNLEWGVDGAVEKKKGKKEARALADEMEVMKLAEQKDMSVSFEIGLKLAILYNPAAGEIYERPLSLGKYRGLGLQVEILYIIFNILANILNCLYLLCRLKPHLQTPLHP